MTYLASRYDASLVTLSICIATFASYVALDLAKRMRGGDGHGTTAWAWWTGGSVALGTGIWSMHFVGMLAFSIPVAIGYTPFLTAVSWCAAVGASAVALGVASQPSLGWTRLSIGSAVMGLGIFAMHYTGMAAIDIAPPIAWNPMLVVLSLVIAVVASASALQIFFWLRKAAGGKGLAYQLLAAVAMGLAISGMHYTGMAAASFASGSVCSSAGALGGAALNTLAASSAFLLLTIALITSTVDARMQSRTALLAASLQSANAALAREHERFRALTTLSSDWFWEQDLQFRNTLLVNSIALPSGLSRDSYLGKTVFELGWKPVDEAGWQRIREGVERRDVFHDWELQRADDQGRLHFISNSGAPLYDDDGAFVGYRGVGRDITQRKHLERREELRHRVTRLLADAEIVEEVPALVIAEICRSCHWQGGSFLPAEQAAGVFAEQFWASDEADATFRRLSGVALPADRAALASADGLAGSFDCPVGSGSHVLGSFEFRFRSSTDTAAFFFDTVRGLALQTADAMARARAESELRTERELLAERVVERTSELTQANIELRAATLGAEAASRAKSAFLATMSHEIRTPMNGVVGMIEVLSRSNLSASQDDAVRTIRASAFVLLSLIDDILDFSKIESGHLALQRGAVSLTTTVESVIASITAGMAAGALDLRLAKAPGVHDVVWTDAGRLRQILEILVGNAAKFKALRPGVRGTVTVSIDRRVDGAEGIVLAVADNGIGMEASTLPRLFQPFMQAEASTTRKFGGTGLGLALCGRLVALMGGEISVRSEIGVGSTFTVVLPLEPFAAAPDAARRDTNVAGTRPGLHPATSDGAGSPLDPRLILVAEDDAINRKVVLMQLDLLGYPADVACDGAEALRLWRSGRHALVLTDLHMPELDGYGLARAIREAEALADSADEHHKPKTPILALTANAQRDEASRAKEAGMDGFLTKPVQLATLGAALAAWLPAPPTAKPSTGSVAATPDARKTARPVDVSVLKGLVGDDDAVVAEFLSDFLLAARRQSAEIIDSCAALEHRALAVAAHKLKASSRSVGALALGDLCASLEQAAQASDRAVVLEQCARFREEMSAVDDCIVGQLAANTF